MKRNVVLCLLTLLSMQVFAQKQSQVVDKIVAVVGKNVLIDVELCGSSAVGRCPSYSFFLKYS